MRIERFALLMVATALFTSGCSTRPQHQASHYRFHGRAVSAQENPYLADPPAPDAAPKPELTPTPPEPVPATPVEGVSRKKQVSRTISIGFRKYLGLENDCVQEPTCVSPPEACCAPDDCDQTEGCDQHPGVSSKWRSVWGRFCPKSICSSDGCTPQVAACNVPAQCSPKAQCAEEYAAPLCSEECTTEGCNKSWTRFVPKYRSCWLSSVWKKCRVDQPAAVAACGDDGCVPLNDGCGDQCAPECDLRPLVCRPYRGHPPLAAPMEDPFVGESLSPAATRPHPVPGVPVVPEPTPDELPTPPEATPDEVEEPPAPQAAVAPQPKEPRAYIEPVIWPRLRTPPTPIAYGRAGVNASPTSWTISR